MINAVLMFTIVAIGVVAALLLLSVLARGTACPSCRGEGVIDDRGYPRYCSLCGGTGVVEDRHNSSG